MKFLFCSDIFAEKIVMKKIVNFFVLLLMHFLAFSQHKSPSFLEPPTLWNSYFLWNSYPMGSELFLFPYAKGYIKPEYSPCQPVRGIDYSENISTPIQPFEFHKLHFETRYGFYLKITLDIYASGQSIIVFVEDYYAEQTTVKSALPPKDFIDLKHILARCDFDSFREEKVQEDIKCCNSFFEISFNEETIRSSGCSFSPFNNRELESALWHIILFKIRQAKSSPNVNY